MWRSGWLPALLLYAATATASAQRSQLELRPRTGDTVRMRLDQVTEMQGGRSGAPMKPVVTTLTMLSRAIVERSDSMSALIVAVTDSVDVHSSDVRARAMVSKTEDQLRGRQMRLRLAPDGSVSVADRASDVPREVNELLAVMPGSFPREPVAIGDTWVREMAIAPPTSIAGVPVRGSVRATFRLDSISRGGDLAYVSMRGTLQQRATQTAASVFAGSVNGSLVVNRRRGWLNESRFLVEMRTTLVATGAASTAMDFRMKITQHMRVVDKR